jgi:DNA-binding Xre family transcriptional regulator
MEPNWRIGDLRRAIRNNRASFPSQVPVFKHQPRADIQWRVALLYFVRDWSSEKIAKRYGIGKTRVQQLIRHWSARAIALGLLDRIPSEEECKSARVIVMSAARAIGRGRALID